MNSSAAARCGAPATRRDRVVDHRRAAGREAIAERHTLGALEQDVGELPDRHFALAAHQLLVQQRRVRDVLLGLGVEPRQPGEAVGRRSRCSSRDFASTIEKIVRMTPEAIGSRIRTRPAKRGCEQIVPVARRFRFRNELLVEDQHRQRPEGPEVEVARAARARRHGVRPRRPVGREQPISRRRGRRSRPARRTRRRTADWPSPSGSGRRPPASPCRASGRRAPGSSPRTPARRASAGRARAANRPSPASARRSSPRPRRDPPPRGQRPAEKSLSSSCGL